MKVRKNRSGSGKTFNERFKEVARPYREQFRRAPLRVKVTATVLLAYLVMPIDPWDVLVPWLAWQDDLFIAGVFLKLLHKYGSVDGEQLKTPGDLLRKLFTNR